MLLSGPELAFAMGVVFLSSAVAGVVGFGMGMMLSPLLLLVLEPQPVVLAVNTLSFVGLAMIGVRNRPEVSKESGWPLVVSGLCGVPLGLLVLETLAPDTLKLMIGAVIVVLAAVSLSRRRVPIPKSRVSDAAFGFSGAALVTGLGVGIPIVAWHLFNRGYDGKTIRATIAVYYASAAVLAIVLYLIFGIYTGERWLLNLLLLPATLAGFWVASRLVGRMKESMLRFAVVAVIIISGLTLLIRELIDRFSQA